VKVLVTGGAGYMGSTLTPMLLSQGHDVHVIDSLLFGGESLLGALAHPHFTFTNADVRDRGTVSAAMEGADAVVHLAAIVGDAACAREPELATKVNLDASIQAFQIARSLGVPRFVFASTCSNYGRMSDPNSYVSEDSELMPVSLYAETKVGVERFLLDASPSEGVAPTLLRFATLYGISPRMRFDLTVNHFSMELHTTGELEVHGSQFWRPYVHVRDAARAIALVLDTPLEVVGGQVFNVGDTDQNYRKGQIADLARQQVGDRAEIRNVANEEDPRDYRVAFDKVRDTLGFQITRTVEDGVREIIDALDGGLITDVADAKYRN
jgi:nucleoside-diphosphate-sugar epimerase